MEAKNIASKQKFRAKNFGGLEPRNTGWSTQEIEVESI
jgi:hypothetical protein